MEYPLIKEIKIPDGIVQKWQRTVDLLAEVIDVPAALIMRVDPPYIEVFRASNNDKNPYRAGEKDKLDGLYCETVMKNDEKLLIPNALKDEKWKNNPDIKKGMISYLGFPIKWPDGKFFGTLCVLDTKENAYNDKKEEILKEFKDLIETHLNLILNNNKLKKNEKRLNITLQSIGDAVITTDLDGNIDRMNSKAEELTGYNYSEVEGKNLDNIFKIYNAKTMEQVTNPVKVVLKTGKVVGLANDTTLVAKDGTKRQIADSASPIENEDDEILGVILVFSDVTEQYEAKEKLRKSEERYSTLFNTMLEGCQVINYDWEYLYINDALTKQVEISRNELIGNKMTEIFPGIEDTHMFNVLKKCMNKRKTQEFENEFTLPDGTSRWFKLRAHPVPEGIFVLSNDITDRKFAQKKMRRENRWYKSLYKNSDDPIVVLDKDHCVVDINQAFVDKFGYKIEKIKGQNLDDILNIGKEDSANKNLTEQLLTGNTVEQEGTRYTKDGKPIECIIKGIPVKLNGEFIGGYAVYNDITDRKKQEGKVRYLSLHDNLTDLYNRAFLETEIRRLDVKRQLPISMIMIDLNGLKLVNDSYGHKTGDKFLLKTAEVLKNTFREEDIIARWGGDEFVILLNKTSRDTVEKLAKRIKNKKTSVDVGKDENMPLSLAVGYSVKTDEDESVYNLFINAEDMMYKDKLLEKQSVSSNIVNTLLTTLQQKSQESKDHSERMKKLAINLGEKINLKSSELERVSLLAVLHDIGKTTIPEEILNKPGELNIEEWEKIKGHPATGFRICSEVEEFSHIAQEILSHHERWDGTGYPQKLKGTNIPLLSRIISIVDAYDVMISERVYSKKKSKNESINELKNNAGSQFDPNLVDKFIQIIR
jgi:diguanylate cyclase (GGDEF)-like protein/PAS domain S-box-containing protein